MDETGYDMLTHPADRPFRFGVTLVRPCTRRDWVASCRRAEALGYDVISLPDHLGMPAPFPSIVAAADATSHIRLSTSVLNSAFYHPAVLARDIATTDQLVDGRLEIGLGTGYVKAEFDRAGLPWPSPAERVDHLERTIEELRGLLGDPEHQPRPAQLPAPPLLVGARSDRTIMLAARHADIIGFTGIGSGADGDTHTMDDPATLAERVEFAVGLLGDRATRVELNFLFAKVFPTGSRRAVAGAGELDSPALLAGTPTQMAETLREHRKAYGFSYFTVREPDLESFGQVIDTLN